MKYSFVLSGGKLSLELDGRIILSDIYAGYNGDSREELSSKWKKVKKDGVETFVTDCASLTYSEFGDGIIVKSVIIPKEDIEKLDSVIAMGGRREGKIGRYFGNIPYNANGTPMNEMQSIISCGLLGEGKAFESADYVCIDYSRRKGTIFGFAEQKKYSGLVKIERIGDVRLENFTEYHRADKGALIECESIYIRGAGDIHSLLEGYADICAKLSENSPRDNGVPSGYCTWYYYHGGISEEIILRAIEDLSAVREICPVKYFQIDDGWEDCWGNWEPNAKFPHGMKYLADKIREAGFVPGIWIAPFAVSSRSSFLYEHPECFTIDRETGDKHIDPFRFHDLDYSQKASQEYLEKLIHKLTCDWGFEYIKIDIITATIGPNIHSDPSFTSIENHRRGLEIINRAMKPGTFILGCTEPFLSSIGQVDAMRVSVDVFEDFTAVKNVFNKVLNRYFLHHRFFVNDSDCLIVRDSSEEDSECDLKCTRSETEIRTFVSAAHSAGGVLMLADKLSLLKDEHKKLISYLFPQNTDAGIPLDLGYNSIPEVIDMGEHDGIGEIIILNWNDEERTYIIEDDRRYAYEFWSGEFFMSDSDSFSFSVPPHGSMILFFMDEKRKIEKLRN